jgi:hypothetical protein
MAGAHLNHQLKGAKHFFMRRHLLERQRATASATHSAMINGNLAPGKSQRRIAHHTATIQIHAPEQHLTFWLAMFSCFT